MKGPVVKMTNKSIGVFDSGLGGLTAVKELLNILPNENIVYFGDTGRVPYGNRSNETITRYAMQDIAFLKSMGVKIVIAACGTVSSVATKLKNELSVPFTGVVNPTSVAAINATRNNKIGVIGTTATIKSHSYKKAMESIRPNIQVFEQDCPLFVPLVENGIISPDDPILKLTVERYLSNFKKEGIDTIILGCTHYPIISDSISEFMGQSVTLIDSGKETALFAAEILKEKNLLNTSAQKGDCSFFVSDTTNGFSEVANLFLGSNTEHNVHQVDIEAF